MNITDDHMDTWQAETYVSPDEQDWLVWVHRTVLLFREAGFCIVDHEWTTENTLPIGLDGDQDTYGFSLDDSYTKWEMGYRPVDYLNEVKHNRSEIGQDAAVK